ncbi:hypothetical protein ANN_14146 [Periplaneta americana]|uniref:Uncharacterized protein n=1 Tax=Periplaneta americana TaxID=6978 RepID=A0ABQ8SVJ6_PERAM|nr:hypothetical protein ANN_14146 [Periplaneta americana]
MAGLCEGGSEPPGSLKAIISSPRLTVGMKILTAARCPTQFQVMVTGVAQAVALFLPDPELRSGVGSIPTCADNLVGFIPMFSPTLRRISTVSDLFPLKKLALQNLLNLSQLPIKTKEGLLLADLMPHGTIINSDAYVATLKKLQTRLSRVRRHRKKQDILLLHDNAQPYVSHKTTDQIRKFG